MDYSKLSVKELKSLAEQKNIKGVSKLKKDELISLLQENESTEDQNATDTVLEEEVTDTVLEEEVIEKIDLPLPPPLPQEDNAREIYDGVEIPSDPRLIAEQFRPSFNVNLPKEKKIEIITTIAKYKAEEKTRERQEIKNQMDDFIMYAKNIKDEFKAFKKELTEELAVTKNALKEAKTELDSVKTELKDLRDSFIMKMIMKKVGNVPFEQMPIFKNKVVPFQLKSNN
jgi:hypothetical protein